jgi:hypothetical protein
MGQPLGTYLSIQGKDDVERRGWRTLGPKNEHSPPLLGSSFGEDSGAGPGTGVSLTAILELHPC